MSLSAGMMVGRIGHAADHAVVAAARPLRLAKRIPASAESTQKLMAVISGSLALFPVNMGADCRNTFVSITRIFDENHIQDLKLVLRDVWVSVERLLHGIPHHLADIGGAWLLSAAWLRGGAGRTVNAGRAPGQKHESSD